MVQGAVCFPTPAQTAPSSVLALSGEAYFSVPYLAYPGPSNLSFKVFLVTSSFPHASFLAHSGPENVVGEVSPFFSFPLLALAQS